MTLRRVVIDNSAPLWAKQLETDLNGVLAALTTDFNAVISAAIPVGQIVDYTGVFLPPKFLWPNGQAVSRATYAALFAVLGTVYGAGDGSTTFNLPDLRGRVAAGKDDMGGASPASRVTAASGLTGTTLGAAGGDEHLQAHDHIIYGAVPGWTAGNGSLTYANGDNNGQTAVVNVANRDGVQTTGTGTSQNVQPTIILNKIIYAGA